MKAAWFVLGIGLLTGCGGSVRLSGNPGGAAGTSGSGGAVGTAGTDAGGGGTSGSGGAAADAGKMCGGLIGLSCAANEWCDFTYQGTNWCGGDDSEGVCRPRPPGCPADCSGVCGCDGKFYCNACLAHQAGVDDTSSMTCMYGASEAGTGCNTDSDCSSGLKCCYPCGTPGCTMQCMQPDSNGQCPLFE